MKERLAHVESDFFNVIAANAVCVDHQQIVEREIWSRRIAWKRLLNVGLFEVPFLKKVSCPQNEVSSLTVVLEKHKCQTATLIMQRLSINSPGFPTLCKRLHDIVSPKLFPLDPPCYPQFESSYDSDVGSGRRVHKFYSMWQS